ncbi:MAG: ATP-binding protein [Anaerolineales bacterium]|nr:ATP-binding protein [Anaerolineales bacterium]
MLPYMIIQRAIAQHILSATQTYPFVGLVGPRQSGKTTLAKALFPDYTYVSLENLDQRTYAQQDPRGFLAAYPNRCIFDEIQKVPELFSYLQEIGDQGEMGRYILTGSQNFLLHRHISQSLSGRIALFTIYPFSMNELSSASLAFEQPEEYMFTGMYPPIYDRSIAPTNWYPNYIQTYIERDIRDLMQITQLPTFQVFVKLCAGRIGQILNLSALARDCGITHNTARAWLSLLETSYIVFLLRPYYRNFNKRLVKMPKLYFYDTGLASSLLGIQSVEQMNSHYLRGELFENFTLTEYLKHKANTQSNIDYFFWRDQAGHEIDLLAESGPVIYAVEMKSGKTISADYTKNLVYFRSIYTDEQKELKPLVIYAGTLTQTRSGIPIQSWQELPSLL